MTYHRNRILGTSKVVEYLPGYISVELKNDFAVRGAACGVSFDGGIRSNESASLALFNSKRHLFNRSNPVFSSGMCIKRGICGVQINGGCP